MSKPIEADAARKTLLNHVRRLVRYWSSVDSHSVEEKLSGLAFSMLVAIDGHAVGVPAFDLVVRTHPDDKSFCMEEGRDYYEDGMCINSDSLLHEEFYQNQGAPDER